MYLSLKFQNFLLILNILQIYESSIDAIPKWLLLDCPHGVITQKKHFHLLSNTLKFGINVAQRLLVFGFFGWDDGLIKGN